MVYHHCEYERGEERGRRCRGIEKAGSGEEEKAPTGAGRGGKEKKTLHAYLAWGTGQMKTIVHQYIWDPEQSIKCSHRDERKGDVSFNVRRVRMRCEGQQRCWNVVPGWVCFGCPGNKHAGIRPHKKDIERKTFSLVGWKDGSQ